MKIIILGAGGFIGTNLVLKLAKKKSNEITAVDKKIQYLEILKRQNFNNIKYETASISENYDFGNLISGYEIVYHLLSTTVPATSNTQIPDELASNVIMTSKLLDACVKTGVKKVIFISSGGAVYGKEGKCPLKEETLTNPITTYGIQKITIEKLLYLYRYMYGLDYRVIRLANPYGPYQRPNGILGAVTTFTYKAIKGGEINVFGNGTVIRDYIYIDDVVKGIVNITDGKGKYRTYNFGCGYGTSINELLDIIEKTLKTKLNIVYKQGRKVDVPVNYLDISRYEEDFGKISPVNLIEGIKLTAEFLKKEYDL